MLDDVKKRAGPQPSGGSGVKQGSRYGGSKQKDEPEDKKPMKEDIEQIDELAISPQARADAKAREKDYHDQSEFPVHPERSLVLHTTSKLKSAYSHHSRTAADPIDKSEGHNAVKAMRRLDREFDKRKIPQNKRFAKEEVDINAINGVQMSTIDELSKTTLGSYIKKAANDKADRAYGNGFWDSRGGRTTYPPEDTPIKNKIEVDQKQRNAGIKRAVNKLTKENIEQIDELSKTTLGSYIKKAADDKSKTAYDRGYVNYATDGPKPDRVNMYDKVVAGQKRRNAGIKKAVNKLTREDLDINAINGVQMSTIDEKHMTEPEMKKKEEVVKSMKKGLTGFKARYGDRAKSVMYATATKIAKDKA